MPKSSDLSDRFARFRPGQDSLGTRVRELLAEQKKEWLALAAGYASLGTVQTRDVIGDGYRVTLQFNPGRIVSTGARVDPESIRKRKCFLCIENLPEAQRGILFEDEFLVLCNPAPIFPHHYTISHRTHRPQELEPAFPKFLELAEKLSPDFTLFYNGPKCGASAPDHLHFQASPTGAIPIEHEASASNRRIAQQSFGGIELLTLNGLDREVFVLEGAHRKELGKIFSKLFAAMKTAMGVDEEPLMNVLCSFSSKRWRVILFPRSKHRPDAYFAEGDGKILVSPAAVDIGGLVVTPLEKDFRSLGKAEVSAIFKEVTVTPAVMKRIMEDLKR